MAYTRVKSKSGVNLYRFDTSGQSHLLYAQLMIDVHTFDEQESEVADTDGCYSYESEKQSICP